MIITDDVKSERNKILSEGMQLAENKDLVLLDRGGKFATKITMGQMLEGISDPMKKANTALMLENMRRYLSNMDETTRMLNIGDFDRFAFPIVRVIFPNLILHDIASVQPMTQSIGLVFYTQFTYGTTKGSVTAGQDAFTNPNEFYSGEEIDVEQLAVGDAVTVNFTGNLTYTPIKPGTVSITFTSSSIAYEITDDGNGALVGDIGAGTNTINYNTGAYNFDTLAAPDANIDVNANYLYNMEANTAVPQIDMQLTSSPVRAMTRKLRTLWSMESAQDLMDMHGLNIETEQAGAMVAKLKVEIDREGVNDMTRIAGSNGTTWSSAPGAGVSYTEHKLSFIDTLIEDMNAIFNITQLGMASFVVAGITVSSLIESIPGFVSMQRPKNTRGVYKTGRLLDLDIYKDPSFQRYNTTTSAMVAAPAYYLIGLKGDNMFDTGYIHAPYIMAYTTGKIELDDFITRKGTASRYGKKAVNGNFYRMNNIS